MARGDCISVPCFKVLRHNGALPPRSSFTNGRFGFVIKPTGSIEWFYTNVFVFEQNRLHAGCGACLKASGRIESRRVLPWSYTWGISCLATSCEDSNTIALFDAYIGDDIKRTNAVVLSGKTWDIWWFDLEGIKLLSQLSLRTLLTMLMYHSASIQLFTSIAVMVRHPTASEGLHFEEKKRKKTSL